MEELELAPMSTGEASEAISPTRQDWKPHRPEFLGGPLSLVGYVFGALLAFRSGRRLHIPCLRIPCGRVRGGDVPSASSNSGNHG
jgi:hypothetical protein